MVKVAGKRPGFFAAQLRAPRSCAQPIPVRIASDKLSELLEANWQQLHQEVAQIVAGLDTKTITQLK